ncbi:conserved oligomeric Golgi complex subunit 6 [Vairimorpha necatrix]|uniref:Conserved oligomeric Golgi complex subunit 6 n=1 Tax=Vairimorpha necatrix TaxID=6039 RepID=A0AAX4JDU7_9MICR
MEKLIKQKEKLENDLNLTKQKHDLLIKDYQQISTDLTHLRTTKLSLLQKFEDAKQILKQKKTLFVSLKKNIKDYKLHKQHEIREIYKNKFENLLLRINEIKWKYNLQIFKSFDKIKEIENEAEIFKNLKIEINYFYKNQFSNLKKYLVFEIVKNKELHDMIYKIKFVKEFEEYFKIELFLECMNEYINKRYEYHFASDSETNRLDKAEWVFNFLEKKIKEIHKFIGIYEKYNTNNINSTNNYDTINNINNTNIYDKQIYKQQDNNNSTNNINSTNINDTNNQDKQIYKQQDNIDTNDTNAYFISICKNVVNLIKSRINDIENIDSYQKRNLLINFNFFLSLFTRNIFLDFSLDLNSHFSDFRSDLLHSERSEINQKLQEIHKLNFKEWFPKYEDLIKENLDLIKKFLPLDVEYVVDNILDFHVVFIDSMRYLNRKEIHVLVYLFNMFEEFKENIQYLLEDYIYNINENDKYNDNVLDEEKVDNILLKITKFNLENFKLIKTLFENDINNIINLKFYFINDLYLIFGDYKKCKGFSKLRHLSAEMIDQHILSILTTKKLDQSEYTEYISLYRKLKDIFDIKEWDSRECMKCIKGIFENKTVKNKYTEEINRIYY